MHKTLAIKFLSGWFDHLEIRLGYMAAYDAALIRERKTTTVRILDDFWGMA